MNPLSVVKTLWRHKFIFIPVVLLTVVAAAYLFAFGPRSYQATSTFALVNPLVPTEQQILKDPSLGLLNSNNPYLRSSDNTLIAQVLTTRLNAPEVAKALEIKGFSTEYTVERAGSFGTGLLVQLTAIGSTPEQATGTVQTLGEFLVLELKSMQEINGADQRFLFTALAVTSGDEATEQFSSRLRSVIMVGAGGVVLLFASVSAAQALDRQRELSEKPAKIKKPSRRERKRQTALPEQLPPTADPKESSPDRQKPDAKKLMNQRKEEYRKRQAKVRSRL